jgi:hypothetical protein
MGKKYKSNKYNHSISGSKYNKVLLIPLIFIIAILPFIMRLYTYRTGLSSFVWFPEDDTQVDVFLYYKQVFFLIVSIIMALLIGFKAFYDKANIKKSLIFIPLLIYCLLAVLSTLTSDFSFFGFNGIFEQFESIFVLLGYSLVVYYGFLFINKEDDIKLLMRIFIISILIISILGIAQAIGHDLLQTEFGMKTFVPIAYWDQLDKIAFTFGPKVVYLTLYNPNYVGVYAALIAPILLCFIIMSHKLNHLILYVAAFIGIIISLLGSKSDAGIIGIAISLIFIIIFLRRYLIKHWKFIVPIFAISIFLVSQYADNSLTTLTEVVKKLKPNKIEYNLTDIKTEDTLIITYKKNNLVIDYNGSFDTGVTYTITDSNNNDIPFTFNEENGSITITDERFAGISIVPVNYNELLSIKVTIDGKEWVFTNEQGDGSYYYINSNGKLDKIITAESSVFTGYEKFASNRGYIWSRTIPLLKKYIILGSGADTYALVYPQQDYVYLSNVGFSNLVLTKPHSMYLQVGVQTGVLSLLALLVFYGMYFVSSVKLYIKGRFDNYFSRAGVAIFIGTISYMIVGISNDSSIAVAPIFWALLGIGFACNYQVKKQLNN